MAPINIFRIFLNCVFAKYTVEALLLYSLSLKPKYSIENR